MMRNLWAAALAASALLPAAAQPAGTAPTEREAQQARDNARRDAKLADAMEQARLKEEAKPASVYIPPEKKPEATPALHKPEVFVASVPGSKKKAEPKKKKKKD